MLGPPPIIINPTEYSKVFGGPLVALVRASLIASFPPVVVGIDKT